MAFNPNEIIRKIARWTDDLKKDTTYFGVGNVNNQIHLSNGTKLEAHPYEDRSFAYELIENQIFAYGILDGYNGTGAVDIVEQALLTNVCFDHLHTLQNKTDEEIYSILSLEFEKAEQQLKEQLQELLMRRASLVFQNEELRKGTVEYLSNRRDISHCDQQIASGAFAMLALIIDKKLFVANVGIANCFVCVYDKQNNNEKKVISLESDHSIANEEECRRIQDLNCDLNYVFEKAIEKNKTIENHSKIISYTRCLGDFKLKFYYNEHPQFKGCTGPPLLCQAQHLSEPIIIDESFLFLVMYSDGLSKVLEAIYSDSDKDENIQENINSIIAKKLISKIKSEQTLNSAAQSVLDEIKRAYDDKFVSTYNEREDLTLVVRVFDTNIKKKLDSIENCGINGFYETLVGSNQETNISTIIHSLNEDESENSLPTEQNESDQLVKSRLDENDHVIPYINMDELQNILNLPENKPAIDELCSQLMSLNNDLKTTYI